MIIIPKKVFFTKGAGRNKDKLSSFELALRQAGIEKCNLVYVSSILPPQCEVIGKQEGVDMLQPGQILFCVMARQETDEPNRIVSASIGCAIPADRETYGYLSEYHGYGETDEIAGDKAEDIAASLLASTLGIDFDPNSAWDDRKEVYKLSGKIVKSKNTTQSAKGAKNNQWTTVIAAACFII